MTDRAILTHEERVVRAARDYQEQGLMVVRIEPNGKRAVDKGWPDKVIAPHEFGGGHNIAFQPGQKSGYCVDLDFDDPHAREVAGWEGILTSRYPSFGRKSQPPAARGHRLVICRDAPPTAFRLGFTKAVEQAALAKAGISTTNFAEIRGGGNCYTVLPPSRYAIDDQPDGHDELVWNQDFLAAALPEVGHDELSKVMALIVFLSIARHTYPNEGGRHDHCLHLAGALAELGVDADSAAYYIERIAHSAGDDEADARGGMAHDTIAKLSAGQPVTTLRQFLEAVGLEALEATLRKWFGLTSGRTPPVPPSAINTRAPNIHAELVKLDVALATSHRLFRQANRFVYLNETADAGSVFRGARRYNVEAKPVTAKWLVAEVAKLGIDMRGDGGRQIAPPEGFVSIYLERSGESRLPVLRGITHTPLLTRHEPGYDPATGIFHAYRAGDFPDLPDRPTKADAVRALEILTSPIGAYRFANAASRSVAIAALLTAPIRSELVAAPMFIFDASKPGSGKTKLGLCVGAMALGKPPAITTFAKSDEENRKRIETSLLARRQVVMIDNIIDVTESETLAAVLTSDFIDPRVLGKSENITVDTRAMFIATGNNVRIYGDMARRVLKCRIEPESLNPEESTFSFDPVEVVIANHRALVAAALTILRAYVASGEKTQTIPFGSYEGWSFIAEALVWLGLDDPNLVREEVRADDPEREQRERIFALFTGSIGIGTKVSARQIGRDTKHAALRDEIAQSLQDQVWNDLAAGRKLAKLKGITIGGLTLHCGKDSNTNTNVYWLTGEPEAYLLNLAGELSAM